MKTRTSNNWWLLGLLFILICSNLPAQNSFSIHTDNEKWQISDYLVGMHSVYNNEPDSFYENDANGYIAWMNTSGISTMRYPGGSIVKYWDWENPTGVNRGDPWDPNWNPADQVPASEWFGLDEYLDVVDASGITPLLGVNINSGYDYNKEQESIDRAVRMVNYVKSRGHGGAFWYLGNEGGNDTPANEARLFKDHAMAMKAADPNIKTMFNHNDLTPTYLTDYLAIAGDYIDIAETHGKWPYGGKPDLAPGTFEEWKTETPLRDRKNGTSQELSDGGRAWRTTLPALKAAAVAAGYPNLLFANNEYGHGSGNHTGFNKYTQSLVAVDLLQEHFLGNWYMSCYWSTLRSTDGANGGVVDKSNNYRYNPMSVGFEMLAKAQGGKMLEMSDAGDVSVYGMAVEKNGEILVYLLNKSETIQNSTIDLQSSISLIATTFLEGTALVNTEDLYGESIGITAVPMESNSFTCSLPALSYTRLTFTKEIIGSLGTTETFELLDIPSTENDTNGSFIGDNGNTWTYNNARDGQSFGASGKSIMLRGQDDSELTTSFTGGISSLSVQLTKAFTNTANNNAYVELYVKTAEDTDFVLMGTSGIVSEANGTSPLSFGVNDFNLYGNVQIKIRAKNKPICIDNISWTPYDSCTNETFDNLVIGSENSNDGSFLGNNELNWIYIDARDSQTYAADGPGLMLRGQDDATLKTDINYAGLNSISFDYTKAFTSSNNETAYLKIHAKQDGDTNYTLIGTTNPVGNTNVTGIQTFSIENLGFSGNVRVKITAKNYPVCIDNIQLNCDASNSANKISSKKTTTTENSDYFSSLILYPTPIEKGGDLHINLKLEEFEATTEISIYNFSGVLLMNRTVPQTANSIQITESIHLESGLYFIKLTNGSTLKTEKFIVN